MALTLDDIARLLDTEGGRQYGREAVSQREHALQCAHLAEQAGETPETVVAALLHDLGHLLSATGTGAVRSCTGDDLHQWVAMPFLRGLFPDAVLAPIRLHVDAKRYLCAAESGYRASLSAASEESLMRQGGVYDDDAARAFLAQPFAEAAVRLRRYDDNAKMPGRATSPLAHYLRLVGSVALPVVPHMPA